jgi:hypothetical protein
MQGITESWEENPILLSILRSIGLIFKSQNSKEILHKKYPDLGNWLFALVHRFMNVKDVLQEVLNVLKNFTR